MFPFKELAKNELAKSLNENKAVFHKGCIAKYNNSKLEWIRKLYEKGRETEQGGMETIEISENTETQRKLTRSSISLKKFTPAFLFSYKDGSDLKLHVFSIFSTRLRKLHNKSVTQRFLQS